MAIAVQPFEGTYKLDPNHSSFQFSVTHLGLSTFRPSFGDIDARLAADDDGTIALVGNARVDSISIDDPDFRAHVVHGADFFEADAHPLIVFRSTPHRARRRSKRRRLRRARDPRRVPPRDGDGNLSPDDHRSVRSLSRRPRAPRNDRSPGLGDGLAAAASRRRRRAGLGGRDQRRLELVKED